MRLAEEERVTDPALRTDATDHAWEAENVEWMLCRRLGGSDVGSEEGDHGLGRCGDDRGR